jgi:quercetin dioxygenase-like cupin family protein
MEIKRAGLRPLQVGSADYFTGKVSIEPVIEAPAPSRIRSAIATFEAGARTAWHTHPVGQTLYVMSGEGLAQVWGGDIQTIKTGDTVWFPPSEKHWHGASPNSAMCHFAIQEAVDDKTVDWLEQVSDAQYSGTIV